MRKAKLIGGVALAAIMWNGPTFAQTTAAEAASEAAADDAIIVTARRVNESLQDVPASITVFTDTVLQRAGIDTAEDFVQLTPGVTIVAGNDEAGGTQINIRGLNGARDAEPSVALVVDGILKTNTAALNQDQGDVTQIEILKGPQGAIYGRNAAAGAIVISTRKPGDVLEGRFKASYAEDETYTAFASVSTPLGDKAGLLVSGDYRRTDGQFKITPPGVGGAVDRYEGWNVNGRLVLRPAETVELDVKGRYGKVNAGSIIFNAAFALPAFAGFLNNPDFFEDVNKHRFVFEPNIRPDNDQRTIEGSAKVTAELGSAELTAWAAYAEIKNDFLADGTSGAFGFFNADAPCRASVENLFAAGYQAPSPTFLGPTPEASVLGPYTPTLCDGTQYQVRNQRDISGEIRLAGGEDFRWLAGVYYLDLKRTVGVNLGIDRGFGVIPELFTTDQRNPTEQLVYDRFKTRVYAVFGSLEADLTETLTASVALRYDNEKRKVRNLVPTAARTQYIDFDGAPFTGGAPLNPGLFFGPLSPQSKTFDQIEPKVSLTWKPTSEFTLFANYGKGFKSGGFNNQGSAATIDLNFNGPLGSGLNIDDSFRKETSDAFEAGFKANLADGRITLEGAGYYTKVKDLQFFEFFVGTFGLLRVVSNIDRVDIKGVELGATARLVEGWTVFGALNVTDSEIKRNAARPGTAGNKSPYTADYTVNVGSQIDFAMSDSVDFLLRADLRVTGPTWFSTVQAQEVPTLFGVPGDFSRTERDTFTTLNLRAGFEIGGGFSITAFATNMLNEKYLEEVIPAPEFGGSFISPGARRRVGVEAAYRF